VTGRALGSGSEVLPACHLSGLLDILLGLLNHPRCGPNINTRVLARRMATLRLVVLILTPHVCSEIPLEDVATILSSRHAQIQRLKLGWRFSQLLNTLSSLCSAPAESALGEKGGFEDAALFCEHAHLVHGLHLAAGSA
jgi:hypothetical protein